MTKEEKKAAAKAAREAKRKKKPPKKNKSKNDLKREVEAEEKKEEERKKEKELTEGMTRKQIRQQAALDKLAENNIVVTHEASKKNLHANTRDINVSGVSVNFHGKPLLSESEIIINYGNRYGFIGKFLKS